MSDRYVELILEKVADNEISEENAYLLIKEYQKAVKPLEAGSDRQSGRTKEIAVIGVACRFPRANTKEEYWDNLVKGVDCIREFPAERLELLGDLVPDRDSSSFMEAGYLDRIDTFDAGFFNIPPGEAKYIDPQQRLFLKTTYEAIEDAGYGWDNIADTNTGVYVGYSESKYGGLIKNPTPIAFVGNFTPVIPGRLSYVFNLSGPSVSIATACSSSLVALHMACEGIRAGDCDMAVAGGVVLTILPGDVSKGGIGITSPDGRSKAFDADADGTGWGEGCGVVLLKALDKAVRDKDYIYAVIKGSAINQDGASNEISSPKASAQTEVLQKAWEKAGIDPLTISYLEAHGTGTKIGDPIEMKGITDAFRKYTSRRQFCPVGAVKTNIGHLDSASGMAGLIKVVMLLKHRQIPPTLHFKTPNPLMNLSASPVYINTKLESLEGHGEILRAGVSSFGLSGTNCHVVLEEYRRTEIAPTIDREKFLFTLSAKTGNSLKGLAERYIKYLEQNHEFDLPEICFTANTGRGHYDYRMAIIAGSRGELLDKLKKVSGCEITASMESINGGDGIYYACTGKAETNGGEREISGGDAGRLEVLAGKYISGVNIDWNKFYRDTEFMKIPLPAYAYDEKTYWIELSGEKTGAQGVSAGAGYAQVILKGKDSEADYTEMERKLGWIWTEILGIHEINVNDSFFELGGDSLLATEITAELSKRFGYSLPLAEIFAYPSISRLATVISKQEDNTHRAVTPAPKSDFYPISASQGRQYILEQLSGKSTNYNMPVVLTIEGEPDCGRFEEAFRALIGRHESLRTSFMLKDGEIVQKVHDAVNFAVEYREGGILEIDGIIHGFVRPFDLAEAPLLRVSLVKLLDDGAFTGKHLFLFDMHHIISDGVSMEIIIREFSELYRGRELPGLGIQYKDYALWHNRYLKSETVRKQKDYWRSQFEDWIANKKVSVLSMPLDYDRPAAVSYEGDIARFDIGTDMADRLRKCAADNGATLYMLLLSAYYVLLNEYTGQEDIVVGSLLAGRRQPDLKNIVGIFTNYLPIRNYPRPDAKFVDFLAEVKNRTLQAFENQDVPFQDIVDLLGQEADPSRNPIFDTMIILHNQGTRVTNVPVDTMVLKTYDWMKQSSTLDFKLDIFEESGGALHGCIEYSRALFNRETMTAFSRHFTAVMEKILEEPHRKIKELRVLTGEERTALEAKRKQNAPVFRARPKLRNPYIAPESDLERLVADVCRNVLKVEQVGVHDSFFDLGGNSMMAVKCISQLNTLLNRQLPPVSLFQRPTVSALVELLNQDEAQYDKNMADEMEEREKEMARRREFQQSRRSRRQNQEED